MTALHDLSIKVCAAMIRQGKLSPVELTEHFLHRIETFDPHLRSYACVTADLALRDARRLESEARQGHYRGVLHGIPIGLKDVIDTAEVRTEAGSSLCAGRVPASDALVWARLRHSGAILLGKLHTHEFANGGPVRVSQDPYDFLALNPWNNRRYTGGSSSGPASAVAAGLCMGAVATDTGGSIRIPSSYCGVVGFKPSYGCVDTSGIFPVSSTVDHCGPMAWRVGDAEVLFANMKPSESLVESSQQWQNKPELKGLRIGYIRHFSEEANTSVAVEHAIDEAAEVMRRLGADVQDIELPPLALFTGVNSTIFLAEAYAVHEQALLRSAGQYSSYTRARLFLGGCVTALDYIRAQRARVHLIADFKARMEGFDAVICACTPTAAPDAELVANQTQKFFFLKAPVPCAPFNLLGAPAISVCCGFDEEGLPLALQIASVPGQDAKVLMIASRYEAAAMPSKPRPEGLTPP